MQCQACSSPLSPDDLSCANCGTVRTTIPETPPQKERSPQPTDTMLGRRLDNQYIIQKKLGGGGYGKVYEAEDVRFQRSVAIKVLRADLSDDPDALERFRREGLAAGRIEHPNAVKIFTIGQTEDGLVWMSMELIRGESLESYLRKKKRLSPEETLALIEPVFDVLSEAHEKQIVHRDLKPDNIMLSEGANGLEPKVLDFGIAKLLDGTKVTATMASIGTPAYMPPEQWEGAQHATRQSDLYAVGIIVYRMLSGVFPFEADSPSGWMKKHCLAPPKPLIESATELSPLLSSTVMKALEKDPKLRYKDAKAFKEALRAAVSQPKEETLRKLTVNASKKKRYKIISISLGSILLLFLALQTTSLFSNAPEPIQSAPRPTSIATKTPSSTSLPQTPLLTSAPALSITTEPAPKESDEFLVQKKEVTFEAPVEVKSEQSAAVSFMIGPAIPVDQEACDEESFTAISGMTKEAEGLVVIGQCGAIYTSTNGETWEKRQSGTEDNLNALASTGSSIFVVGDGGTLMHSADRGVTWLTHLEPDFVFDSDLKSIWLSPSGALWVAGSTSFAHKGVTTIWVSLDQGLSFTPIQFPSLKKEMTAVWGFSDQELFVAGDDGILLHTIDGGSSWTKTIVSDDEATLLGGDATRRTLYIGFGTRGTFLRYSNNRWESLIVPGLNAEPHQLISLNGDILLAGRGGSMLRFDTQRGSVYSYNEKKKLAFTWAKSTEVDQYPIYYGAWLSSSGALYSVSRAGEVFFHPAKP